MIRSIRPISCFSILKSTLLLSLLLYSLVCTVAIVRMRPTTLVIGIDSYGTRIIETKDDRLIRLERHNFVKTFLTQMYNYNSAESFNKSVSSAGDLMSSETWKRREHEFNQMVESLKGNEVQQVADLEDLREIDPVSYEADLKLTIKTKLNEKIVKVRVVMNLKPVSRTTINPYPWEISVYEEHVL